MNIIWMMCILLPRVTEIQNPVDLCIFQSEKSDKRRRRRTAWNEIKQKQKRVSGMNKSSTNKTLENVPSLYVCMYVHAE